MGNISENIVIPGLTLANGAYKDRSRLLTETFMIIIVNVKKSVFCYTLPAFSAFYRYNRRYFALVQQQSHRIVKPGLSLYRRSLYWGSAP